MTKTTTDKVEKGIKAWLLNEEEHFRARMSGSCESPIEELLFVTLANDCWLLTSSLDADMARTQIAKAGIAPTTSVLHFDCGGSWIVSQARVEAGGHAFRLDLAMIAGREKFAIELDGHDFHERTKEQARKDKSRDRFLTLSGWKVLRFTGSEVFADPQAVVDQINEAHGDAVNREYDALVAEYEREQGRKP